MGKASKRMVVNRESIDSNKHYPLQEAISLLKKASNAKFNETIDIERPLTTSGNVQSYWWLSDRRSFYSNINTEER